MEKRPIHEVLFPETRPEKSKIPKTYGIYYHGTSRAAAESIRNNGMQLEKKDDGCAEILKRRFHLCDPASKSHHYVTTSLKIAAKYSKMHAQPEIVRLVIPEDILAADREGHGSEEYKIKENIPSYLVLPRDIENFSEIQRTKIQSTFGIAEPASAFYDLVKRKLLETRLDAALIRKSKSFMEEEEQRDKSTLKAIRAVLDLSKFKDGEAISVDLDLFGL